MNLTLLPFHSHMELPDFSYSQTTLSCDNVDQLHRLVQLLQGQIQPLPREFKSYMSIIPRTGTRGYGLTTLDGYKNPINCYKVESLMELKDYPAVVESARNRAVWAYLAQLDPSHLVAVFWH